MTLYSIVLTNSDRTTEVLWSGSDEADARMVYEDLSREGMDIKMIERRYK